MSCNLLSMPFHSETERSIMSNTFPADNELSRSNIDWEAVEERLTRHFHGRKGKNGADMVLHSIAVGRLLRERGCDDLTIFTGYYHDVWEDTDCSLPDILAEALEFGLPPLIATQAVHLVATASYQPEEYLLEKPERKKAACARWLTCDHITIAYVKIADVECNDATADSVGEDFARGYRAWAYPLRVALISRWKL